MKKVNLDGSDLVFPRDERISFEESTHTYLVDGVAEMTPVSSVVSKFFRPFDAVYWSLRKCNGDVVAAARMSEEWDAKGSSSAQAGTHLHRQIENYLNTGAEPELRCRVSYEGMYVRRSDEVDISREWSFFEAFDRATVYHPFRTEWCVFDEEAGIAGTIDLLCSRDDGTFEIYDWKRSNKVDPHEDNRFSRGINGLEQLKWKEPEHDQVTYDVTVPFTRYVAGPADYTQGAMRNAIRENYYPCNNEPMSQGTRCRQLAEYIIFDAPFTMLCDSPTNYEAEEECTRFIASIPTVWDETMALDGRIGEFIVMARRKAGRWYLAAMNNWNARDVTFQLPFEAADGTQATLWRDGVNAHRNGQDYKKETVSVAGGSVTVHLAPGGGCVLVF